MPEAPPAPRINRPAAIIVLLILTAGTLLGVLCGVWELLRENRGDGLWYLSLGIAWFMFWGWRLRWITNPKPVQ